MDQSPVTATEPVILTTSPVTASAPIEAPITPFIDPKLIQAIIAVESDGNDSAIGDLHLTDHAYGCMQIRQGLVDICNTHLGTHYKSQDCLGNRDLSILLFNTYYHVFSHLVTNEERSKGWNGGGGYQQYYGRPHYEKYSANLDAYWIKVQKYL